MLKENRWFTTRPIITDSSLQQSTKKLSPINFFNAKENFGWFSLVIIKKFVQLFPKKDRAASGVILVDSEATLLEIC